MKRRNREVNIFNMSLLDILCGALGAFCFMMLSLLPYYRPPGKDINISKEQKELLDEVQKIKDLAERLKNTSTAEDQRELVEMLRREIAKLENEIKKLQGQVNALYAENDELRTRVTKLEVENGLLRTRNEKLELENRQLLAEKQRLLTRNEQLEQQNQQLQQEKQQLEGQKRQLENRINQRMPWTVAVNASGSSYIMDCSLHEEAITGDDGNKQEDFDPALPLQPTKWTGDYRLDSPGRVERVNADRAVGSVAKFYIQIVPQEGRKTPVVFQTAVLGSNLASVNVPPVTLPAERDWVFAGRFKVEARNRITFIPTTDAERDAEWERLMKKAAPKSDSMLTDAVMGPGFEKRKKEFENMTGGNAPPPVRLALLQKWLAESQSGPERAHVKSLLDRESGGPQRRPEPGTTPRPGLSKREEALEEFRKRAQEQQNRLPPPPPPLPPTPAPKPTPPK